jgi:hypothetical protein
MFPSRHPRLADTGAIGRMGRIVRTDAEIIFTRTLNLWPRIDDKNRSAARMRLIRQEAGSFRGCDPPKLYSSDVDWGEGI